MRLPTPTDPAPLTGGLAEKHGSEVVREVYPNAWSNSRTYPDILHADSVSNLHYRIEPNGTHR